MRRLPWHVATRPDRRALLTATGVALGVAFAVLGFTVPGALDAGIVSPEGPLVRTDHLVARRDGAPFDPSALGLPDATAVALVEARLADGALVRLAALEGTRGVPVEEGVYRPAPSAPMPDVLRVSSPAEASFRRGETVSLPLVGRDWVLVSPSALRALQPPGEAGSVQHVVAEGQLPAARVEALEREGYVVRDVPGAAPFFRESGREVARDLVLVVAFSSVLVGLFTYEFLRSEVREKRREIGLWRALGMRSNDVLLLLLARCAAISAAGAVAGAALATAALGAAGALVPSDVLRARPSGEVVALLVLVFLLVGVAGGAWPSWSASRGAVREQMEAAP